MPLSENEMKQIDTDALKCSEGYGFGEAPLIYSGYKRGATAQAEKYQNEVEELKEKLIEHNANSASVGAADAEENWAKEKDTLLRDRAYWQLEAQAKYIDLSSRDSDIEQWKAAHDNCAAHFDEQSRELRELREVAKGMADILKEYVDAGKVSRTSLLYQEANEALAAYRNGSTGQMDDVYKVTHWMPFPSPPNQGH